MSSSQRNIYEQQSSNRRTTVVVMALFVLMVVLLGYGVDLFLLGSTIPIAAILALLLGLGSSVWSLKSGAGAVLRSAGAIPVQPGDPKYYQLHNVVEEMSIAAGLPLPGIHVIPDPDPNAFATGKDPQHAHIAVTKGLLEKLNREELQGVVAHEMSHIRNEDIRLMTVVAALIGAVALLSEMGLRTMRYGSTRKRQSKGSGNALLLVVWLVGLILAPLVSRTLAMAVSRQREYLADASGAELTRNPSGLASALEKIAASVEPTRSIKKGTAHLCIADPLGRAVNSEEGRIANLFATHPPVEKRIQLLKGMAYQKV